jgi:hypothetical protein
MLHCITESHTYAQLLKISCNIESARLNENKCYIQVSVSKKKVIVNLYNASETAEVDATSYRRTYPQNVDVFVLVVVFVLGRNLPSISFG